MAINASYGGNSSGRNTQTAGTVIQQVVPPLRGGRTRISTLRYNNGGAAHTGTVLRCIGRTTLSVAAAADHDVVNIAADPGITSGLGFVGTNALAAGDVVAIREVDGITRAYTVSSVSTLAITLTSNLVAGAASGASFWDFGIAADTDPRSGSAHPSYALPASVITTYIDDTAGVSASFGADEPLIFQSNNVTAQGVLELLSFAYTAQ